MKTGGRSNGRPKALTPAQDSPFRKFKVSGAAFSDQA